MTDVSLFKILFSLAAGLTAWVGAIMVNRRFGTERAMLVVKRVSRNAHGGRDVVLENIGVRGAAVIRLSADGGHLAYLDGLAAGAEGTMALPGGDEAVAMEIVFVDASRHRRRLRRSIKGGEAPVLEPVEPPGWFIRLAQWLRLTDQE